MPKRNHTLITLPTVKPDCCAICPLVGLIPKHYDRPRGSKETHVCLGTYEALTGRGIKVRASQKDSNHRLRRPCDDKWDAWQLFPGRKFAVNTQYYLEFRVPYEQGMQMTIKFHR